MHYPVITAIAAGVIINLQMILMILTGSSRYKHKQGLGIGDNQPELLARVRSHGNLAENAAIVLVVLALLEMAGVSQTIIALCAGAFVMGRLLHPIGLFRSSGTTIPRALGVSSTAFIGMGGGLALIYIAIGKLVS